MPDFGYTSRGGTRARLDAEVEIRCHTCGSTFFVSEEFYNYDSSGPNQQNCDLDFSCPNCEKRITVFFRIISEPNGNTIYEDVHLTGADVIKGLGKSASDFGEEIYTLDESLLYLPEKKNIVARLNEGITDLVEKISKDPKILYTLDPRVFEELIATIFSRQGFHVTLTKKTRDGGRDIIAIRSDLDITSKFIIECKRYAPNRPVRVDLVRSLYGVQVQEGANKSVLATTSYFTPDAMKFASEPATTEWAMSLKDYNDVVSWCRAAEKTKKR